MHRSEGGPGIGCPQKKAKRRLAGPRTVGLRSGDVFPLGVQEDRGKEGRVESLKLRGPEAGRCVVKRRPPSEKGSTVGARGVEGPKGGRRWPLPRRRGRSQGGW
jgi:hypothetical protein